MSGATPRGGMPRDLESALDRLDAALASGRADEALTLAEACVARWPDEAELHHGLAVALRRLDRAEDALESLDRAMRLDASLPDPWLDAAEILIEDLGDEPGALEVLARARRHVDAPEALAEIELLRGMALAQLEDYTGALQALDEAARHDPSHPDVQAERGAVLVELLRFEDAERALRQALGLVEESARAHELLAFVLDYTGRRDAALPHFRRAAELDPELAADPPRVSEAEFDALVDAALGTIPEPFAAALRNVEISVENYADKDFCRRQDCSPTVLGLYVGTPLPERGANDPALPDRIILFQRALENASRSPDELVDEIAVTLKHEIGHLMGFSDDDLEERGHG